VLPSENPHTMIENVFSSMKVTVYGPVFAEKTANGIVYHDTLQIG
jgi:hypothetical protein